MVNSACEHIRDYDISLTQRGQTIGLAITCISLSTQSVTKHWRHVLHLCALTAFGVALDLLTFVLVLAQGRRVRLRTNDVLVVIDLALALLAAAIVYTMPRSATLHFEPRRLTGSIYEKEVITADETEANVSPLAWASPISHLLFNWASPLLAAGAAKPQLDASDIPRMKSSFRAVTIFQSARDKLEHEPAKSRRPHWFNPLLWRLIGLNRQAFLMQFVLAMITSVLYYGPALFLNRLISFLENREDNPHATGLGRGYAYIIGLLAALIADAIFEGQLWYLVSRSGLLAALR